MVMTDGVHTTRLQSYLCASPLKPKGDVLSAAQNDVAKVVFVFICVNVVHCQDKVVKVWIQVAILCCSEKVCLCEGCHVRTHIMSQCTPVYGQQQEQVVTRHRHVPWPLLLGLPTAQIRLHGMLQA